MMYELFGFELSDFKGLFYVFCLAVLVYRYITVGRKYPLFCSRNKESKTVETRETDHSNADFLDYNPFDINDYRSNEYWYHVRDLNDKH